MAKTGFGRYRDLKKKRGLFKVTQLLNKLKGIFLEVFRDSVEE